VELTQHIMIVSFEYLLCILGVRPAELIDN